jgi:hypothetical protein
MERGWRNPAKFAAIDESSRSESERCGLPRSHLIAKANDDDDVDKCIAPGVAGSAGYGRPKF